MNRYLKKYNDICKQLEKESGSGYETIMKLIIANEYDCCFHDVELEDLQEENIIDFMYSEYIYRDCGINPIVNATCRTLKKYTSYIMFMRSWNETPKDFYDIFDEYVGYYQV